MKIFKNVDVVFFTLLAGLAVHMKGENRDITIFDKVFQRCGGNTESCSFEQFFLIYLTIGLSTTSPSRKPSRPRLPNPDKSQDSVVTIESSVSSSESFDIIGLRFFSTLDYVNVGQFDIPGNCLIITSARPLSC